MRFKIIISSILLVMAMSGCGIRPSVMDCTEQKKYTPNHTGLLVLEWFEDGPLYSYLQLEKVDGGEIVYLKAYNNRNAQHPNPFYNPRGEYTQANSDAIHPLIYELPEGEYRYLRLVHQEPVEERITAFTTNLKPSTFHIRNGEATYIGSFQLFANKGILMIKPDTLALRTLDKSGKVDAFLKSEKSCLKRIPMRSEIKQLLAQP